jgi:pimeloyl-ACP methyl ester carboxylesterase
MRIAGPAIVWAAHYRRIDRRVRLRAKPAAPRASRNHQAFAGDIRMRTVATIAILLTIVYALGSAWLAFRQSDLIYHPQATRAHPSATDFELDRGDATLRGWRIHPGQRDAIIYFGGNAESIESMAPRLVAWFPRRTSYLLAYRGYGASDGRPGEAVLTRDAVALYDAVRDAHPDGRIALIGRSLGSGIAAHVARERPVDALVLITPFDSLVSVARAHMRWLPVHWLLRERFEAARDLAGYRGRVLIIRAGRDEVVPPASTQALIDALPVPPTVVELHDAGHNTVDDDPRFAQSITAFLR